MLKLTMADNNSRRYLPTLAELIDRLCIVQMKEIFISENAEAYHAERADIEHDIDLILKEKAVMITEHNAQIYKMRAKEIHAIIMLALANLTIWNNENKARAGGDEQNSLLKFTHSINGVRNTAKNVISVSAGDRKDLKIDCLAADIPVEFGNWKIF